MRKRTPTPVAFVVWYRRGTDKKEVPPISIWAHDTFLMKYSKKIAPKMGWALLSNPEFLTSAIEDLSSSLYSEYKGNLQRCSPVLSPQRTSASASLSSLEKRPEASSPSATTIPPV